MAQPIFSKRARTQYDGLEPELRRRVKKKLEAIAVDPFDPAQSKSLVGKRGMRSARVGDWRILFMVEEIIYQGSLTEVVNVFRIRHRREVYRDL